MLVHLVWRAYLSSTAPEALGDSSSSAWVLFHDETRGKGWACNRRIMIYTISKQLQCTVSASSLVHLRIWNVRSSLSFETSFRVYRKLSSNWAKPPAPTRTACCRRLKNSFKTWESPISYQSFKEKKEEMLKETRKKKEGIEYLSLQEKYDIWKAFKKRGFISKRL